MSDRFVDSNRDSYEEDKVVHKDERRATLHDSTLNLQELLVKLLRVRPPQDMDAFYAKFWRDALVIVLRHFRRARKEQYARILAAELVRITGTGTVFSFNPITGVQTPPNVATARSMGAELKKLLHRSYSRGSLKPIDSHVPWLLRDWYRQAEKALDPLTRTVAERFWRERSPKRFPADLWADLNAAKTLRFRAKVIVAKLNGCSPDSLNRTLQRARQRSRRLERQ